VTALSLTAVGGTGRKTGIALATNHLFAVVLGGKSLQRRFNDTTTETEDQVKSGFLLDVVIGQGTAIFELLTSENQTLLIRGDTYKAFALDGFFPPKTPCFALSKFDIYLPYLESFA
jgi:hypothetical protein